VARGILDIISDTNAARARASENASANTRDVAKPIAGSEVFL
jgi:hypothetical protein